MTKVALSKTFKWRLRRVTQRVGISFLAVLLLVATPILAPYMIVGGYFSDRRKRRAADRTACQRCGRILGAEAIRLSDQRTAEYWNEQRRLHPNIKLRIVRDVYAICTKCGANYGYCEGVYALIDASAHKDP